MGLQGQPGLTDDEYTVLEIAASGEFMIPIGRWEAPVKHLAELGYLDRRDSVNYTITDAGKKACGSHCEEVDDNFAKALIAQHNVGVATRTSEQIAQQAATLIRDTANASGKRWAIVFDEFFAALERRVEDILGE